MNTFFKLLEKLGVERKDIKPFLFFAVGVAIVSAILINAPIFNTIGPVVLVIVFGIFFSILWFVAGYVVFRSLLAASVGLSLIIFIGQSYCALPVNEQVANTSLMTLIGFGFIYVVAQFGYSLFRELFGDKRAKEEWRQKGIIGVFKEINHNKHSWMVLVTYGLLVSLFVWQIYSVIKPIIDGLCVYVGK
jgi:hypothetical protein